MKYQAGIIRIDEDVFKAILAMAEPTETPNAVLRRVFGLPPNQQRPSDWAERHRNAE